MGKEFEFNTPLHEASIQELEKKLNFADCMTKAGIVTFLAGLGVAAGTFGVERVSEEVAPFTIVGGWGLMLVGGFVSSYSRVAGAIVSEIEARGLQVKGKFFSKRIEITEIPIDSED